MLFEGSQDIRFFSATEISKTGKFEVKFVVPIPAKLPSSLYYFGKNLSTLLVDYTLTANLTGLKTNPG